MIQSVSVENISDLPYILKVLRHLKDLKIRSVSVINLITDKRLDTIKPNILPINDRQVGD